MEISQEINNIRICFSALVDVARALPRRAFYNTVAWNERLIGVLGAKGVGKTTLLLQRFLLAERESLYFSLDHPLATTVPLTEMARQFSLEGGKFLFLDEVHKLPDWSTQIKAIFDTVPQLHIVFSGSSSIRVNAEKGDLSRRAALYSLPVLSLREYLMLENKLSISPICFKDMLQKHEEIAREIVASLQPVPYFKAYLQHGAYPFYREGVAHYMDKLRNAALYTIETDLVQVHQVDPNYIPRLKKLLQLLALAVPFTPNISALAQSLEISRASVLRYLQLLELAGILALVQPPGRGYQKLSKPEKIYLDNSNLIFAFSGGAPNVGTLRESFCLSQLRAAGHSLQVPREGDFLVDDDVILEVGGKSKGQQQIKEHSRAFVLRDDIEVGHGNMLPLWLLGFLY